MGFVGVVELDPRGAYEGEVGADLGDLLVGVADGWGADWVEGGEGFSLLGI